MKLISNKNKPLPQDFGQVLTEGKKMKAFTALLFVYEGEWLAVS